LSCTICTNELQLEAINVDMVSGGVSLRAVARKYNVSPSTLSRHRHHIKKEQAEAALIVPPSIGSPSDQLKVVVEDLRRVAKMAETSGHLQSAVAALKTIGGHLELLAKLSGELQQPGTVNVNIRAAWEGIDPAVMLWALARHIEQMLSTDPHALDNLKQLAAGPCPLCKRYGCAHDLL
jgi:transposase-like protein